MIMFGIDVIPAVVPSNKSKFDHLGPGCYDDFIELQVTSQRLLPQRSSTVFGAFHQLEPGKIAAGETGEECGLKHAFGVSGEIS